MTPRVKKPVWRLRIILCLKIWPDGHVRRRVLELRDQMIIETEENSQAESDAEDSKA